MDNALPTLVAMSGRFVNRSACTEIRFGPPSAPLRYACVFQAFASTRDDLICETAANARGVGLQFTVTNANLNVTGTDTINYDAAPLVTRVRGCRDRGNATVDCGTEGGQTITILGEAFAVSELRLVAVPHSAAAQPPVFATVNGAACAPLILTSTTSVECGLPRGDSYLFPKAAVPTSDSSQALVASAWWSWCPATSLRNQLVCCPTSNQRSRACRV